MPRPSYPSDKKPRSPRSRQAPGRVAKLLQLSTEHAARLVALAAEAGTTQAAVVEMGIDLVAWRNVHGFRPGGPAPPVSPKRQTLVQRVFGPYELAQIAEDGGTGKCPACRKVRLDVEDSAFRVEIRFRCSGCGSFGDIDPSLMAATYVTKGTRRKAAKP